MPMKIAVMTDVHGNLPALQAALEAIQRERCDAIHHTGDAIAIGPHPAECLDLLLSMPNIHMTMGNHEMWFVYGLPEPRPSWMSDGEVEHQNWVHAQLTSSMGAAIAQWPYVIEREYEDVRMTFLHYEPADSLSGFAPGILRPSSKELDTTFAQRETDVVFYGHTHVAWDVNGRVRYINPGSLGCHTEPLARFVVLEPANGNYTVEKRAVWYDDAPLFEAFERRQVPDRAFICQAFFGGRHSCL